MLDILILFDNKKQWVKLTSNLSSRAAELELMPNVTPSASSFSKLNEFFSYKNFI
jgi:hypothetical protein